MLDSAAFPTGVEAAPLLHRPSGRLPHKELTLLVARRFLGENGGRLKIDASVSPEEAAHKRTSWMRHEKNSAFDPSIRLTIRFARSTIPYRAADKPCG